MNEEVTTSLVANMAFENAIDPDLAKKIIDWLDNEGAIDYQIVNEVYDV